jgi:DNA mismatch endonuclease (patch repair protein)
VRLPRRSWASSPAVRRSMQGNRSSGTKPEEEFTRFVRTLAPDLLDGMWMHAAFLPGTPDFAWVEKKEVGGSAGFGGPKVAVFVNGCFWHRHGSKNHKWRRIGSHQTFWMRKFRFNRRRDARVAKKLRRMGFAVLTTWECRLRARPGPEIMRVAKIVRARR